DRRDDAHVSKTCPGSAFSGVHHLSGRESRDGSAKRLDQINAGMKVRQARNRMGARTEQRRRPIACERIHSPSPSDASGSPARLVRKLDIVANRTVPPTSFQSTSLNTVA